ncbi:SDR family NAD(P)-dependent oxidoreductase [uncultured Xanthomonas sp.]|uniref:SDR family NAD(P)-dependent oxidoreductase n=1 Tax=uncultured Xanthomonas sp. TaxID=152831 RepID=UPI0025F2C50B|nr:SDR family NAD(P)-dependent oxidoreductase [uncultured Xanthomonas sp.]
MDTAIIGMAFRFPGANDTTTFWKNLIDRKSSVTEIPAQRWDWRGVWGDPKHTVNKTDSKWGGFIDTVDAFDHEFFGFLPKVVQSMDPQQRIMLELAWNCMEDAGVAPSGVRGRKIAVVVGVFNHDYKELQERDEISIEAHHSTGTATAVIANRVSHYFDLRGPSVPIDTACSSSLNAIHNAIQALQYDDCEMALAGGINLMLTPTRHISFSKMGMLSPSGICKTFDDAADGYVRGEGAAFLLLKPLERAIADGDAIHGVIKGSAVNHCGSTYTLTYPSPQAQAEVIMSAHERAQVAIDSLGFVELHGTGTPKGDPIEFEGLLQAFGGLARKQGIELPSGYCGVSSVKTNIGHLEAAAGVAGVIKVLLAMRYRRLPPFQNFARLNHRIAIEGTPFYVLDDSRRWLPPAPGLPLRAGVSSFGFGGTNAHVILEEAPAAPVGRGVGRVRSDEPVLIALSAKTAAALQRRIATLRDWARDDAGRTRLIDVSRTLLLGRDALACRFACVVDSPTALLDALNQAMDVNADDAATPESVDAEALQALLSKWPKLKKQARIDALSALAKAFRGGAKLSWSPLFAGVSAQPVRLPGYPFKGATFWTPAPITADLRGEAAADACLHPLLHQNVSVLGQQRFRSTFDGREFFLVDHVVDGRSILPGVAYLEMARAAANLALADTADAKAPSTVSLRDVVWQRPLEVTDAAVSVELELDASGDGVAQNADPARLRFRVVDAQTRESAQVYCQGRLHVDRDAGEALVDIDVIGNECVAGLVDSAACYRGLAGLQLQYGPTHRAIADVRLGTGQCLARIVSPTQLAAGHAAFVVHPSTADAALQAAVVLASAIDATNAPRAHAPCLPFALDRLDIVDAGADSNSDATELYAWARFAPTASVSERVSRLDIDLIECVPGQSVGRVRLAFRGLSLRPRMAQTSAKQGPKASAMRLPPESIAGDLYAPLWVRAAVPSAAQAPATVVMIGERDDLDSLHALLARSPRFAGTSFERLPVLAADAGLAPAEVGNVLRAGSLADAEAVVAAWKARGAQLEYVVWIAPRPSDRLFVQARIDAGASTVFALVKAMLRGPKRARFVHLHQQDFGDAPDRNGLGAADVIALGGFYKALAIEKPSFSGRVVQCPADSASWADLVADELLAADKVTDVRYRYGLRETRRFAPVHSDALPAAAHAGSTGFRAEGAYVITGGLGALGLIVARHLCERYRATVYLTGRRPLSEAQRSALEALAGLGGRAVYFACDISDRDAVRQVFAAIREDLDQRDQVLNGVLHSAGVIEDDFLLRKPVEAFARVIAPKTLGVWCLDQETQHDPLDLFVLFSSVTGVLGNVGQSDYAFGNAFEDAYSAMREMLVAGGQRSGRSVSINWPYWQDGGMRLGEKEEGALQRSFGIVPLTTQRGIEVLEYAIAQAQPQVVVMPAGDIEKVREVLGVIAEDRQPAAAAIAIAAPCADEVHADDAPSAWHAPVSRFLANLFASQLGISADFEPDRSFKDYGFDSVVMIDLIADLERSFGTLPKTLFFEYQTLGELSAYFVEHHPERCRAIARPAQAVVDIAAATGAYTASDTPAPVIAHDSGRAAAYAAASPTRSRAAEPATPPHRDDIAIIGLAGRYPQAETLEAFWDNLRLGRDCVEEIPADRPDLAAKFRFQPGEATRASSYSRWGGFLRGVDQFDPLFFNISPKEAENIDPNERLFLEIASQAIEDAGYTPDTLAQARGHRENPVGVYAGLMWGDYQLHGVDRPRDSWVVPHSFYWAVANRVSYQFNFSGPSLTIDTACSSSLTAIHLACQAIGVGEIDVAIAGAVNLSLHPNKYNLLSDMHFLSSDGRCRAFGEGGNGYVPGEGVGAVVLKGLAQARRDGDHIYGVIRGSSINHGGRASGFTVPNPKRQAALVQQALDAAGVDARHISYVEAHGTGTSLGDPIEVAGLTKAFAQSEHQYCAIGSAKSNLGHLEAAAGIAGLTKVLLQMRHRSLVPSIHSDTPNPYIDFAHSPFRVQRSLQPWLRPVVEHAGSRRELPRLAGISSFGAGGSNGHLIVEEYVEEAREDSGADAPVVVVLSARRDTALREMAAGLARRLQDDPTIGLQDTAYTLQIGRIAMEVRVAFVAASRRELLDALRLYAEKGLLASQAWSGHRDAAKRDPAVAARGAAAAARLSETLAARDLAALAQAWVDGVSIDWRALHVAGSRRRVPLPGYAFQRQRYWVETSDLGASVEGGVAALHPLIDANVSTLEEQAFLKTFRPDAFYLRDHRLGDNRVLPGVVYLELALQASRLAAPGRVVMAIEDVHWYRPIIVNDLPQAVRISLLPERGAVAFAIDAFGSDAQQPHADGAIVFGDAFAAGEAAGVDLAAIAARTASLDGVDVEAAFSAMGFAFGESFRVFESLRHNADEALGMLRLPRISGVEAGDFVLHPALIDGAIRASLGVGGFSASADGIRVPVRLRRIEILAVPGEQVFVHARRSAVVHGATTPEQSHFDLSVCDAQGRVLVRIEQLTIQSAPQLSLLARARTAPKQVTAKALPATMQSPAAAATSATLEPQVLQAIATARLVELLANVTKLAPAQIDPHAPLENYGIDSVMIAALNRELELRFGEVPKTLFFEYQELSGIAGYLAEDHADALRAMAPASNGHVPATQAIVVAQAPLLSFDAPRLATQEFLRRILGETVGLGPHDIDPNAPLENYGIDSVMIVKLTGHLEVAFGAVSKTLFFEYQDVASLAEHLAETFPEAAQALAGAGPVATPTASIAAASPSGGEPSAAESGGMGVQDQLFRQLRRILGADAANCSLGTPIAHWPLDAVNILTVLHALARDFEGVDASAPYRHHTLADWAAELQWHEGRAEQIRSELHAQATASNPMPASARALTASSEFRRLRGGSDRFEAEDIAIVGLSGRYPGANDLHAFWQNLSAGRDSVSEIPLSRWDHGRYFHPDRTRKGAVYSKWGGFIDGVDQFDARFFNISAREAELIDPQERLFLQTAWECVEDACQTRQSLKGRSVGVYVGVMWGYYAQIDVTDEQLKSGRPNPPFSSIANRVSYFMNLDGPSMAVDTMCSSSLTAIHLACRAIHNSDCEMAIAGGVNVIVHPNKYQKLSAAQFLSSDGRCRAFGANGDGYVPGEGVGAVMLKRLSQAIQDGDHVYGVIKATSLNHGGKTNGYTVPNQLGQTNVIGKALSQAGWDPRSIDYIEAHGTGTSLGDPIEIAGLTRAFDAASAPFGRGAESDRQKCRIGSVKSNVGHLESAAAIAGLTKILLQFRHDAIAPSLHASPANPNIDFAQAPFRVVQQQEPWIASGSRRPRRAGLSSFGAGGANAHCLIEDHPRTLPTAADGRPVLFVLSADGEERLMRYVDRMIAFLERGGDPDVGLDLRSLAYSSQIGREAMDERLAIVATSVTDLLHALRACRAGSSAEGMLRGSPRRQVEKLEAIVEEGERDVIIRNLIVGGRLPQLARAWVSMLDVEWARYVEILYPVGAGSAPPHRVPFPTMPFVTQRYWVEEKRSDAVADAPHPLIDRNLSTLATQIYRKRFDGQEFYLRDHIVHTDRDRKILPGVAYLEMARAAGDLAAGEGWRVSRIRNFAWRQPFEIAGVPDALTIRMHRDEAGLQFDVLRESDAAICADGELVFQDVEDEVADEWLDIRAIVARGTRIDRDPEAIYSAFRRMGFHFGPSFKVTQARYRLAEGALCELRLPAHLRSGMGQFGMHPSLLDAALRAGLAVEVARSGDPVVPIVPFALDELEIRHPLTETCYAHVVRSRDALAAALPAGLAPATDATAYKYDILVTDADGRVLAKLHGFSGRALVRQESQARAVQFFDDHWLPAPPALAAATGRVARTMLVVADDLELAQAVVRALPEGDRGVAVAFAVNGEDASASERFDPLDAASASALFDSLRDRGLLPERIVIWNGASDAAWSADGAGAGALHRGLQAVRQLFVASEQVNPGAAVRMLYAYRDDGDVHPQHEAIIGYARSLLMASHRFELSTLSEDRDGIEVRARTIIDELEVDAGFGANEIAWRGGRRLRRTLRALPMAAHDASAALPLRETGTYLITGGAGKLGLAVAHWLATTCRARLLLCGRSAELPASARETVDAIRALGAQVEYRSVDIADTAAIATLVAMAEREFGGLNGVIHCAGNASDRSILELDDAGFNALLAPKVDGLIALDHASASLPLDFFVAFSSVSALIGDLGSGAYAAGNRFMDSYALWREAQRARGLRHGRSLSIGWPLWATGGMEITGGDSVVFGFSGMQALSEAEGLEILGTLLRSAQGRVLVTVGDPQRIAKTLRLPEVAEPQLDTPAVVERGVTMRMVGATPVVHDMASVATRRTVHPEPKVPPARHGAADASSAADALGVEVEHLIKQRMATVTKTQASAIGSRTSFEQCGMDSVLMLELHNALRADFAELPKTALFEYDSAAQLAHYLLARYPEAVRQLFPGADAVAAVAPASDANATPAMPAAAREKTVAPLNPKRLPAGRAPAVAAEAIAIIGMAGEFPASPDLDWFWRNLREGRDCLTRVPATRGFASSLNDHRSRSGQSIADAGGFLADVELFDPKLFRMSQVDADKADPQLRVLLRAAWRAVEDAVYTPQALAAYKVGVFVGAMNDDFSRIVADLQRGGSEYIGPGSVASELSNRLSFVMNFHGPSLTVSTACSGGLTALHLARQSILADDCEVALVGGINLSLHQSKYQLLHDMKVLSPDGKERTFDEGANGLVPSEGAGVVVLKRLSRAIADGDHIHGVIRASRIGHFGTGPGQFMPNLQVMEDTVADCIRDAGLVADDIDCIEAHGTGTELGDPIELKAIDNALRRTSSAVGGCAIGSKAGIGHMEAASGVGSLIKVLLSMRHGEFAPCAKLRRINSNFDHAGSVLRFPDAATAWPRNAKGTRIAGINSFGMGGANAFVVVESHESAPAGAESAASPVLFVLSARSQEGLKAYADSLAAFMREQVAQGLTQTAFADLAYASQVGRIAYRHRLAVVAADAQALIAALEQPSEAGDRRGTLSGDIEAHGSLDVLRLLNGDAGEGFVDTLLRARDLDKLAELWVRGAAIDWPAIHHGQSRRRASFPGTPFEQVRCDLRNLVVPGGGSSAQSRSAGIQTDDRLHIGQAEAFDAAADASAEWRRLSDVLSADVEDASGRTVADAPDDEWVRRYWIEHLADAADTVVALGERMSLESAAPGGDRAGAVHVVSEVVDPALTQLLQAFGSRHGIALETLIAGAWAVLLNRYSNARYSQFGLLGADHAGEPVLLPVRVRTVGRQKMLEWLGELQATLLRKHRHACTTIERIGEWVGREQLFDCVVSFASPIAPGEDGERHLASEAHPGGLRPRMELAAAIDVDSLELSLMYRAVEPDHASAAMLLEQIAVLLEGIVSNPDRMPSALGMRTKSESRERFWKAMDAKAITTEGS